MSKGNRKRYRNRGSSDNRAKIESKIQEQELKKAFWEDEEECKEVLREDAEMTTEIELIDEEVESKEKQKWYVLDTNLILSCVNVLYDPEDRHWRNPLNFEPDLSNAHLIIPETVKDELNGLKNAKTFNGIAARTALKRLAKILPNSGRSLNDIMYLTQPIPTGLGEQTISVLPLHRNFAKCLPWVPKTDDNDGWIATSALAAKMIRHELPVDGTADINEVMKLYSGDDDVILLTRDADLLEKADRYAVASDSYDFELRQPYEGYRELVVPAEMFEQFYHEGYLSQEDFNYYMPDELPLVANEYIIMTPKNDEYPRSYFASATPFLNIARYHKENGMLYPMRYMKSEGVTPPNAGIATYYDALNDDRIVVITVDGNQGTGKTFQAILHAIREVKAGRKIKVMLISSRKSKNELGALPGKKEEKMEPLKATAKSAIFAWLLTTPEAKKKLAELRKYGDRDEESVGEYSGKDGVEYEQRKTKQKKARYDNDYESDDLVGGFEKQRKGSKRNTKDSSYENNERKSLEKSTSVAAFYEFLNKQVDYIFDRYFECCPREEVDGKSFHNVFIIVDEIQRIHDFEELLTILTRSASNSKMVLCGDVAQIRGATEEKLLNNGITHSKTRFYDLPESACIHLTENMRGGASALETEDYAEAYARIAGY